MGEPSTPMLQGQVPGGCRGDPLARGDQQRGHAAGGSARMSGCPASTGWGDGVLHPQHPPPPPSLSPLSPYPALLAHRLLVRLLGHTAKAAGTGGRAGEVLQRLRPLRPARDRAGPVPPQTPVRVPPVSPHPHTASSLCHLAANGTLCQHHSTPVSLCSHAAPSHPLSPCHPALCHLSAALPPPHRTHQQSRPCAAVSHNTQFLYHQVPACPSATLSPCCLVPVPTHPCVTAPPCPHAAQLLCHWVTA